MNPTLRAIRGATTVAANEASLIEEATSSLLGEMFERNGVTVESLVNIFFSATPDLDAAFPASAARALGLVDVPLFGSVELAVTGSVARCIRVMVQCYSEQERSEIRHVYTRGAKVLRTDLAD